MKTEISLGTIDNPELPAEFHRFYFAEINTDVCMQDTLHILTKLRKSLININSDLVIGNHAISVAFLINLVNNRP